MPRQVLELIDYLSPLAALIMFAVGMFLLAFFVVNFFYISERDDLTVFEKFGAHFNVCLGPHPLSEIYRGGPAVHPSEDAPAQLENGQRLNNTTITKNNAVAKANKY